MEASLAELLTHVPVILRRPGGEIVYWSEGCREVFGFTPEEAVGKDARTLLRTEFPDGEDAVGESLAANGEWRGRLRHKAKSGRTVWTETVMRLREAANPPGPIVVEQSTDITGRIDLEERSALLTRELEHRVKNVLSVVQALARITYTDAPADQHRKMQERLIALAEANKLLHEDFWKQAELRAIVCEVSRRLGIDERIALAGPDVAVASHQAMDLALAVHELCTNAIKYGALSSPSGSVEVSWAFDGEEQVRVTWRERDGPPVTPPSRNGFGTRLIRQAFSNHSGKPADLRFEPDGVVCEMTLPARQRNEVPDT